MSTIDLDGKYRPSEDIVAREIEGEIIIVPLVSGIGDTEDDLFTLNETGRSVWKLMDGLNSVKDIIRLLSSDYEAPPSLIEQDVLGLTAELLKRRMIIRDKSTPDA